MIPNFVKNRAQYHAAFACILGIILMNTLAMMIGSTAFKVFGGVVVGFLQLLAVLMLVLCAGGMTMKTLAGEMGRSYEVIRRGEEEKEVIVPLTGAMPMAREIEPPSQRINLDMPPSDKPQEKLPLD